MLISHLISDGDNVLPTELAAKVDIKNLLNGPVVAPTSNERAAAAELAMSLSILGRLGRLEIEPPTTSAVNSL